MTTTKTKDGFEYYTDSHGVIHQLNPEVISYDVEYVDTYRTPEYQKASDTLMSIRLNSVLTAFQVQFKKKPLMLLDVGYGDGSFLNNAKQFVPSCFGYDISGEDVPKGCKKIPHLRYSFDVVCFWDAFEHIPDLSFIKDMKAKMIFMSMPNLKGKNFETWKHRKPNEHLHHFTPKSLESLMFEYGWKTILVNHQEDEIRKGEFENIMTMAFIKNK